MTISIRKRDRNHLNYELKTANSRLVLKSPDNITQKNIPKATNAFVKPLNPFNVKAPRKNKKGGGPGTTPSKPFYFEEYSLPLPECFKAAWAAAKRAIGTR